MASEKVVRLEAYHLSAGGDYLGVKKGSSAGDGAEEALPVMALTDDQVASGVEDSVLIHSWVAAAEAPNHQRGPSS